MPHAYIPGLAALIDWHDGDTVHGVLDLGDGLTWGSSISIVGVGLPGLQDHMIVIKPQRFRIAGLMAPELKEPGGMDARNKAATLVGWGLWPIRRYGLDKWRRPLIDIELKSGRLFSEAMLEVGGGRPVSIGEQLAKP